jgi:hypothetical protein
MRCRIHIKGHLDPSWQEWLGGLILLQQASDTTLLIGTLPDQAALHGVLVTLRRLNLSLLSLQTDEASQSEDSLFFLGENKSEEPK